MAESHPVDFLLSQPLCAGIFSLQHLTDSLLVKLKDIELDKTTSTSIHDSILSQWLCDAKAPLSHGNNSTAVAVVAAEVQAAAEAEIGSDADAVLQI